MQLGKGDYIHISLYICKSPTLLENLTVTFTVGWHQTLTFCWNCSFKTLRLKDVYLKQFMYVYVTSTHFHWLAWYILDLRLYCDLFHVLFLSSVLAGRGPFFLGGGFLATAEPKQGADDETTQIGLKITRCPQSLKDIHVDVWVHAYNDLSNNTFWNLKWHNAA